VRVASLHLYPVKSCRGIDVARWEIGRRGLRHDRRFMIVRADGGFMTQRETPALARVAVDIDGASLALSAEGHGEVRVPLSPPERTSRRRVRVWRSEVDAVDCGPEAAGWLSAFVGEPASLVHMPDDVERAVSPDHARAGDIVGFADGFPVLVTTAASLADLVARLPSPVPMARFRPNVVVEGGAPWAEDRWKRVRVGAVPMRVAKPCARCVMITTDQRTGERGPEPLRTLATFRTEGGSVLFGQNCIPDATGFLEVGSDVEVLPADDRHSQHS
jgi:uncharacterized protein YcbX